MKRHRLPRETNLLFKITAEQVHGQGQYNIFDEIRTKVLKSHNRGLNIPVTAIVFVDFDTEHMRVLFRIMWTKSTRSMLLAKQWADRSGVTAYSLYEILKRGGLI